MHVLGHIHEEKTCRIEHRSYNYIRYKIILSSFIYIMVYINDYVTRAEGYQKIPYMCAMFLDQIH
jgi:hypothetical protein